MPLTRESNLEWRSANPGKILHQRNLTYDLYGELFSSVFISEQAYEHLSEGAGGIPQFWRTLADVLANHVEKQLDVADGP